MSEFRTDCRREIAVRTGRLVVSVADAADCSAVEFTPAHSRRVTVAVIVRGDEAMGVFARAVVDAQPGGLATACVELADQLEGVYSGVPDNIITALERVPVEA